MTELLINTIDSNLKTDIMADNEIMQVQKRTGEFEEVSFDKILKRIKKLSNGLHINPFELTQLIINRIYNGITTAEIDELAANLCANKITQHLDYETLASRICISNHHKNTSPSFSEVISMLWNNTDIHGIHTPIVNEELYNTTMKNKTKINTIINYENDYKYNYFGFKTLERSYLLKVNGKIVERPQQMLMRVALSIHKDNLKEAFKCYKIMSEKYFTHATPTLFNMGTQKEQAFSCFLLQMNSDSIPGIYKTLTDCALISQHAGGIGVAIHKIRAKGTAIRGTGGISNGIVPMLKNFNETARYVDQGGGKRQGSFAMYLEPWHADIEDFLMLKRNTGAEELRARDLFYAMWIPDLFMERVRDRGNWTLMCPDECPGLHNVYGDEFKALYERYETEGRGRKTIPAEQIWRTIIDSQIETGTPYIVYKDSVNRKSNQKNLGTIQSSNLCVSGETLITTENGDLPIGELENQQVHVWNGENWSETTVRKTGINQKLIKVIFTTYNENNDRYNKITIECTPYHKFYIYDEYKKEIEVRANQLKSGDIIYKFKKPSFSAYNNYLPEYIVHKIIVDKIIDEGKIADTYCVNEPLRHRAMFNGILTGQCAEIVEYTAPDEHAVCCLASVSLPTFLKTPQLEDDVQITVYTKNNCMYCSASKAYLKQLGIPDEKVKVINVENDLEYRSILIRKLMKEEVIKAECDGDACAIPENPSFTLPQIWIGDKYIGGYEQLLKELRLTYDYDGLIETTKQVTRNLNKLIDYNYYPVPETETSNRRHRPIGVGVQGLADVFAKFHIPFDSDEALELSAKIAEAMYLGAAQASMELARKRKKHVQEYRRLIKKISTMEKEIEINNQKTTEEDFCHPLFCMPPGLDEDNIPTELEIQDENERLCEEIKEAKKQVEQLKKEYFIYQDEVDKLPMGLAGAYSTFVGSPASEGKLQFDLWREEQPLRFEPVFQEEWKQLKEDIKKHGMRNSLLMAMMPTASTSQILGNNECIEPYTNNIYKRRVNAGEFTVINNHLITDLINLGIWNNDLKDKIIAANGSIQEISAIPKFIRRLYKTVWEIKQKWLIDHAVVRSPYVCQTQSMNLFISSPTPKVINAMHFYAWKSGLKTGIYYLRSLAKTQAQKFSIDLEKLKKGQEEPIVEEEEICLACSA
jgi:ribonucleotide reductase alpha subunit